MLKSPVGFMFSFLKQKKKATEPRLAIVHAYSLIAVIYCAVFSVIFYSEVKNIFLAALHAGALLCVICNYILLQRTKNFRRSSNIILTTGTVVVTSLFATGGWENSGYLWTFAYLPFVFFLPKSKVATKWVAALFTGYFAIVALHFLKIITIPYSPVVLFNYFAALLICVACIFLSLKATAVYHEHLHSAKTEDILRSEQKFRALTENSSDMIGLSDENINPIYRSPSSERITGWSNDEVTKKGRVELTHPEDTEMMREKVRIVLANPGQPVRVSFRSRHREGHYLWFEGVLTNMIHDESINAIISNLRDVTKKKKAEAEVYKLTEELRVLVEHVQTSREEERKYIAREIHDELGQALTALKIDVSMMKRKMMAETTHCPVYIEAELNSIIDKIDNSIESVKRIANDLRPEILDHLDIVDAIKWQAQQFENITGIQCSVSNLPDHLDLESSFSTTVYRTIQEALTNVTRHSEATVVRILIERNSKKLLVEINDNGKGIKEEDIKNIKSLGLIGMRERVLLLNGTLSISGKPSMGTTIAVELPME